MDTKNKNNIKIFIRAVSCMIIIALAAMTWSCGSSDEFILEAEGTEDALPQGNENLKEETEMSSVSEETGESQNAQGELISPENCPRIYVFVCGAVERPGVYELSEGARLFEAIEAAGGMREEADPFFLNQAQVLSDGASVRVYTLEETADIKVTPEAFISGSSLEGSDSPNELVNINSAGKDELMTLPGIGEAKASAIIAYREEHGSFGSIEEVKNVAGIKESIFASIKDRITS